MKKRKEKEIITTKYKDKKSRLNHYFRLTGDELNEVRAQRK